MFDTVGTLSLRDGRTLLKPGGVAAHPEVAGFTGQYFSDCRVARTSPAAQDDAMGERLWSLSVQHVSCRPASCLVSGDRYSVQRKCEP